MRCGSPIDRFSLVISVVQEANFNEHLWKSNVLWSGQENMPSRHCRPMVLWKLFNWMVWDWDLWIKRVVSDINLALGHIDSLSQKGDVALVIHLQEKQCIDSQDKTKTTTTKTIGQLQRQKHCLFNSPARETMSSNYPFSRGSNNNNKNNDNFNISKTTANKANGDHLD